ncbi:MAG: MGMT family protein [Verrucomicrobia bacterium]|nr:MGMT family protein [Verrucomicrobiota bacterium]
MTISFSQGPSICISLQFEDLKLQRTYLSFSKKFECKIVGDAHPALSSQLLDFLEEYGRKRSKEIDLPLESLPPFRQKVLKNLQKVPFGEVMTYGELALMADNPRAARAVGSACHYNPYPLFIPCHRVVASGGKPGGFAYDMKMKILLLDFEKPLN